jgi:transglutaminase-like putative cysteine protease
MTDPVWRLIIEHSTQVTYPEPVASSYNEIRVQPSDEPGQSVLSSRLDLDPFDGVFDYRDYFGTVVAAFDIHQPHTRLSVVATSTVETFPRMVKGRSLSWDELEEAVTTSDFDEYRAATPLTEPDEELAALAAGIRQTAATPSAAGRAVCDLLHERMAYATDVTGVHTSAAQAWREKAGVCQDFSHLAIGMLRSIGVPTRYVSGYLHPSPEVDLGTTAEGESHAWVEWYDGEWTAFDPTNDVAPGRAHVVIGRGRDYRDVPPIKGVYAGPKAIGNEVSVKITRVR